MTEQTTWRELRVVDRDGHDLGTLADALDQQPHILRDAVLCDGEIEAWPDYLICTKDEDPAWDTPREPVDWTGFERALTVARQTIEQED